MGSLVTLDLPADSPVLSMPWIITFGPASDDEAEWEPVVIGPYERDHALALAHQVVVDDDDLMAVVEPLMPMVSVGEIQTEIASARERAANEADLDEDTDFDIEADLEIDDEEDELDEEDLEEDEEEEGEDLGPAPSAEEIRAGFARIAARLSTQASS